MTTAIFKVNRGSDLVFDLPWPDGAGGNADLTGYTASIFEPAAALAGRVTATMDDPATGIIRVRVEWADTAPCNRQLTFRVAIALGDDDTTTNLLAVVYQ